MVNKIFTDNEGIQMECFLTKDFNCRIKMGQFDDYLNLHCLDIDNLNDIDELIKELKSIRKIMHNSKL